MTYITGKRELNEKRHSIPRITEVVLYIVLSRKNYVDRWEKLILRVN
jgi:hypothetical protein